jgi:hypothetical protein
MDRRDFLKSRGVAGGAATGFSSVIAGLGASEAAAAHHEAGAASGIAARDAMHGLLDTIREVETTMLTPAWGFTDPARISEAERAIAHILWTGLNHWLEADPNRPVFQRYVTPTRKLLGCNPDAIYFFAPIRDDREYRVTGNIGAATFTSFTLEKGSDQGRGARGSVAAISDEDMEIAYDGSYEILISRKKPKRGNWLQLSDGASQVTTRHYHEARQSVGTVPHRLVPIQIEALNPDPLPPYGGDARAAERLTWVANYVREHCAMTFGPPRPELEAVLGWVSKEPNVFTDPGQWASASGDNAYGNTHAWYGSAFYALEPDEALVITGRFPACRFANVVLWNDFMQAFDYQNRRISYNRNQVHYEKDGSYRMVVAHRDPGVPNWLDTEGRPRGNMYWRYIFPTSAPARPETEVVKVSSLS